MSRRCWKELKIMLLGTTWDEWSEAGRARWSGLVKPIKLSNFKRRSFNSLPLESFPCSPIFVIYQHLQTWPPWNLWPSNMRWNQINVLLTLLIFSQMCSRSLSFPIDEACNNSQSICHYQSSVLRSGNSYSRYSDELLMSWVVILSFCTGKDELWFWTFSMCSIF